MDFIQTNKIIIDTLKLLQTPLPLRNVPQARLTTIARDYPLEAKIIRKAAVRLAVMRGVHKLAKVTGARDSSVPFDC